MLEQNFLSCWGYGICFSLRGIIYQSFDVFIWYFLKFQVSSFLVVVLVWKFFFIWSDLVNSMVHKLFVRAFLIFRNSALRGFPGFLLLLVRISFLFLSVRFSIYVCKISSSREIFLLGLVVNFHCYTNFFEGSGIDLLGLVMIVWMLGVCCLSCVFVLFVFLRSSTSLIWDWKFFGFGSMWGLVVRLVKPSLSISISVLSSFIRFIIL